VLKSLAYCGILLSGVGAIVLAMIHAQGDPDDIYGDVVELPPGASLRETGSHASRHARCAVDGPSGVDPARNPFTTGD
jgi:hypothetical protein